MKAMSPPADPSPRDHVGAATLERLAAAPNYNRWMFDRLRPWIGQHVLEVGSGIGNLSAFLQDRERVVLTDTEPWYLDRLRERFDTVICLNVLEHVEDDRESLAVMRRLLAPGGRLVLLVPALAALYGSLDRALGHCRRYGRGDVTAKLREGGLRPIHVEYFNLAGIPGWWLTGRVLRRSLIPTASLRWFDALVPLFRWERLLPWRIGQSLIVIGEAPA